MKGKIKCFGLLSVLAIMLGLSLSVSSNANALKYEITTIPYGSLIGNNDFRSYGINSSLYDPFTIALPLSGVLDRNGNPWTFKEVNPAHRYNMVLNSETGQCDFDNSSNSSWNGHDIISANVPSGSSKRYFSWRFPYYDDSIFDYTFTYHESLVPCNKIGSISNINNSSFPAVGSTLFYLRGYVPYRYNYNGIYAQDSNTQNGLNRKARFDFGELFGSDDPSLPKFNLPDRFSDITIPIGIFTEKNVPYATPMEVKGRFAFDSLDPQNDVFNLDSDFNITYSYNVPAPSGTIGYSVSCTSILIDNRSNEDEYPWYLDFSCPFNFAGSWSNTYPEKTKVFGSDIKISGGWQYPAITFAMTDFYFVTNNDLTPAGKAFSDYTIDGSAPQDAPGSALDPSKPTDYDWIDSLSNLFSFQLFNPFSGFFLLFTDNSGCVNIPIIAGMLHSESDTYCPWFSAETRNIMTPVIGILSTMFIFGFIVKWFKSTNSDFSPESSQGGD